MLFFLFPTTGQTKEEITISADNAILMEALTGRVLYEKDADEKRPIASITKVMTALVAIRYADLSDNVTISSRAANSTGSSIYVKENKKVKLEDLLYGLMLRSGNDAAVAIAEHVGGSVEGFVYLMNETAISLGMTNSHFSNPHGLDDPKHYSSAYDMAILLQQAYQNETFQKIFGTKLYQSKAIPYPWHNKHKLLTSLYEPTTGGKTGYTSKAGRTLITTAEKNNLTLIAVTLHGPDDWNDQISLFDWGFEQFKMTLLGEDGKKVFRKDGQTFNGYIDKEFVYPLQSEERKQIHRQIELNPETDNPGQQLGTVKYFLHGDVLANIPIYKMQDEKQDMEILDIIFHLLKVEING